MQCPCGSGDTYRVCCQSFIEAKAIPTTAEQLMRSRFSAYALKNADYLFHSYAKESRGDNSLVDIQDWAEQTLWLALVIISTEQSDDEFHYVEFAATYLTGNELWQMQENSRFIKEDGKWCYVDGDVKHHKLLKTVARNEACPCNSGKKFKRCCMQ